MIEALVELGKNDREGIITLCKEDEIDATLLSCLQGKMGRLWVDQKENPTCAIGLVGDFCFLFGSAQGLNIDRLMGTLKMYCTNKIIVTDVNVWGPRIEEFFPTNFHKFKRYHVKGNAKLFDIKQLETYITAIGSEYTISRIDDQVYDMIQSDYQNSDFCSNFESKEDFLTFGIGYVALYEGDVIAGASSYSYCDGMIDVQIETKEEHRRKGLALACGSKLILACLDKNIFPRWDAANLASVALAEKLGYQFDKEYEVYAIG